MFGHIYLWFIHTTSQKFRNIYELLYSLFNLIIFIYTLPVKGLGTHLWIIFLFIHFQLQVWIHSFIHLSHFRIKVKSSKLLKKTSEGIWL